MCDGSESDGAAAGVQKLEQRSLIRGNELIGVGSEPVMDQLERRVVEVGRRRDWPLILLPGERPGLKKINQHPIDGTAVMNCLVIQATIGRRRREEQTKICDWREGKRINLMLSFLLASNLLSGHSTITWKLSRLRLETEGPGKRHKAHHPVKTPHETMFKMKGHVGV